MTTSPLYLSENLYDQACAATEAGKYNEAAPLYKQALEKRIEVQGADDASVAQYTHCLGRAYVKIDKAAEADEMFKKAVAILEKVFYAGHGLIAPVLEDQAELYLKQGKDAEAEPILKRALEINEKCLSGDHRITLETMYKMAMLYRKLGKNPDAETLFTKALKSLDTPLGPSEEFKFELAQIKEQDGKLAEAMDLYRQALVGFEQRRSLPRLVQCLETYAKCLRKDNKAAEAEKVETAAKRVREISKDFSWQHELFPATLIRA